MGLCISGTPDYPSNQTVTVAQWETKGCDCAASMPPPGTSQGISSECPGYPETCCPVDGPKSQCYRAAYNEKSAYASVRLMEEYGVVPATSYPAGHPKFGALGVAGGASPSAQLPACDLWSRVGDTSTFG